MFSSDFFSLNFSGCNSSLLFGNSPFLGLSFSLPPRFCRSLLSLPPRFGRGFLSFSPLFCRLFFSYPSLFGLSGCSSSSLSFNPHPGFISDSGFLLCDSSSLFLGSDSSLFCSFSFCSLNPCSFCSLSDNPSSFCCLSENSGLLCLFCLLCLLLFYTLYIIFHEQRCYERVSLIRG